MVRAIIASTPHVVGIGPIPELVWQHIEVIDMGTKHIEVASTDIVTILQDRAASLLEKWHWPDHAIARKRQERISSELPHGNVRVFGINPWVLTSELASFS